MFHTYNTVDTETAQVGCNSDGCGASASQSHEDNSHLVTAEGNTYTTSNSNSSSIGCQTGKGCEASYKDSKKSESIVDGKTTTHIQTTDLSCQSGSSCNASAYQLDSTITQNADGTTTRDYTEFGVQCEGGKCNGSIATDELDDLEDMVDNIEDFDINDLVEIPNGIAKDELANITASLTPEDAGGFIQFVKDNPLATAGGAAGGVAALLGAYYAISGRRREDDDSATLINRDDGEGAGDGLEGGLENGSTGSPTGEPAIVGEGTGTPTEPVIIGGNTTAPEGVKEREGNSDTEDLPDDEDWLEEDFYVQENIELLQNYYYATTKEQAKELLQEMIAKDPENTELYQESLQEAITTWHSIPTYKEQMEQLGKPAEAVMNEQFGEKEPNVETAKEEITTGIDDIARLEDLEKQLSQIDIETQKLKEDLEKYKKDSEGQDILFGLAQDEIGNTVGGIPTPDIIIVENLNKQIKKNELRRARLEKKLVKVGNKILFNDSFDKKTGTINQKKYNDSLKALKTKIDNSKVVSKWEGMKSSWDKLVNTRDVEKINRVLSKYYGVECYCIDTGENKLIFDSDLEKLKGNRKTEVKKEVDTYLKKSGVPSAIFNAIATQESNGNGFIIESGQVKIRFEADTFWRRHIWKNYNEIAHTITGKPTGDIKENNVTDLLKESTLLKAEYSEILKQNKKLNEEELLDKSIEKKLKKLETEIEKEKDVGKKAMLDRDKENLKKLQESRTQVGVFTKKFTKEEGDNSYKKFQNEDFHNLRKGAEEYKPFDFLINHPAFKSLGMLKK